MDYLTIIKQLSTTFFITILGLLTNFIFFTSVTRTLDVSDYGVLSLFLVITSLLLNTLSFKLEHFFTKDLAGKKKTKVINSIKSVFPFYFTIIVIILLLLGLLGNNFLELFGLENYYISFIIILMVIFIRLLHRPLNHYLQISKQMSLKKILVYFIDKFWMIIFALSVIFFSITSVSSILLIQLITILIISSISIIIFSTKFKTFYFLTNKIDSEYSKKAFLFSLPLVPMAIAQWAITASDRFFIEYFVNSQAVGEYSYIYSLVSFIFLISVIMNNVLYPYIAEEFNKKRREKYNFLINSVIKYSLALVIPMCLGLLALDKEIITMVSGPKFLAALSIMPVLIFFPLLQLISQILQKPLLINNKSKVVGYIYLCGMVLNLILNFILVPIYGYFGAAISTVATFFVFVLILFYFARNILSLNLRFIKPLRIFFASFIMYLIVDTFAPSYYIEKLLVIGTGVMLYGLMLLSSKFISYEEINTIKKYIFPKKSQ